MQSKSKIATLVSCSLLLAACGGGGSGNSETATAGTQPGTSTDAGTVTQATLSFSGVAAVGAPLANAKVTVKCIGGAASTSTDQSGNFTVQVNDASLPCVAQAVAGNIALHSATDQQGVFNVTTLTDLMLASLSRKEPSSFYETFNSTNTHLITATGLQEAQSRVRFVLPYMVLSTKTNFVTTKFVADGKDPMDAAMDVIGKGYDATGKAALRRDLAAIETLYYGGSLKEEFKEAFSEKTLASADSVTVDPKEPRKFYLSATLSSQVYANGGAISDFQPVVMVVDYALKTVQKFPTPISGMLPGSGFTLDPNTPNRFMRVGMTTLGGTPQMALIESRDYGVTWQQVSPSNAFQSIIPSLEVNVRNLRFSADGANMFAYSTEEGTGIQAGAASYIAMSVNGGVTWQRPQGFTNEQVGPIYVSPENPLIVYAINNGKFLKSNDKGLTFTVLPNLPESNTYSLVGRPVAVDPFNANTLFVLGSQSAANTLSNSNPLVLYKSTDGGQTWNNLNLIGCCDTFLSAQLSNANTSFGSSSSRKVHFSSTVKGLIYFPIRGDANNVQMLRSKDGGVTWKLLSFFKPSLSTEGTNTVYTNPAYFSFPIYSTAPRADGGVDLYLRAFDGKGIDRFIDYLDTK